MSSDEPPANAVANLVTESGVPSTKRPSERELQIRSLETIALVWFKNSELAPYLAA
jgi:hypothetical protein